MKFIYTTFFLLSAFSVLANTTIDPATEASNDMTKNKLDFCCDRDKTDESAQDMSEQEANLIVKRFFPDNVQSPNGSSRRKSRGKGQR